MALEVRLLVSLLATLPLAVAAAGGSTVVAKVAVPGTPCGVAGSPGAVWVTEASNARLVKIDPATNVVVKSVPTDRTPCELRYASGSIWVVTQSGRVDRFNPATAAKIASIPVGRTSYDLTYALGAIWVTNRNGGTVQRISVRANKVVKTVRFPPGVAPAGIGFAAGAIWVGDDHGSSIFRLDPRTYRLARVPSGGQGSSWIATSGNDVWVSNTTDGTVTRIDAVRRRAVSTVQVGISPVNLDVIGGDVWVPNDLGNTISRIDGTTGKVVETIQTGEDPAVVAGAEGDVWASMFQGAQVWRIPTLDGGSAGDWLDAPRGRARADARRAPVRSAPRPGRRWGGRSRRRPRRRLGSEHHDGTISRVGSGGAVVTTIKLGAGTTSNGFLDSAVVAGGKVWVARDGAAEIDQIDPAADRVTKRVRVALMARRAHRRRRLRLGIPLPRTAGDADRPDNRREEGLHGRGPGRIGDRLRRGSGLGGLFGFDRTPEARPGRTARYSRGWGFRSPATPKHGIIDAWWVAAGAGSLWVAETNYDRVLRVTGKVARAIPVPVVAPFGVAFYRGAAWVAGSGKVTRIDPATNRAARPLTLEPGSSPVFTQVAAGPSGLWATDYDQGVLYRLRVP